MRTEKFQPSLGNIEKPCLKKEESEGRTERVGKRRGEKIRKIGNRNMVLMAWAYDLSFLEG